MPHPFENFLHSFVPPLEKKATQLNKATWILETTGSKDAADLKADLDAEWKIYFSDSSIYQQLLAWEAGGGVKDPLLKRQLNLLIRCFKQNQIDPSLLEEISKKEAILSQNYAEFRAKLEGKELSENQIREILKTESDIEKRKKAWEASKQIGDVLAPQILELVDLRNKAARTLGYSDFFQMQLELQEVDRKWLLDIFEKVSEKSDTAYAEVIHTLEANLAKRFGCLPEELGPWAWSEPFCQEDPLDSRELDSLLEGVDIVNKSVSFYDQMGMDVRPILNASDMWERPGKCQHAFCIHIDRKGDVRTLNNVQSTIKWLETVLHEFGHAVYDMRIDQKLPWLLREPPHMITTEAMALLMGRQAYLKQSLPFLVGSEKESLIAKADESLKRRQLIFSRWVLVMTTFESELYRDPRQNLNQLWWECVEKFQKIRPPKDRETHSDWAAKYHMGLAPAYYFSYLLGEMFASSIQAVLRKKFGVSNVASFDAGSFLREKLFEPGDAMHWNELVKNVTGQFLQVDDWLSEFGLKN